MPSLLIRKIAGANIVLIIQYAASGIIPLVLIPHIVDVIGMREYGYIALLLAWSNYGAIVVQYAFHLTGPQRITQLISNQQEGNVFICLTVVKFILLLFVVFVILMGIFFFKNIPSGSKFSVYILFIIPISAAFNSIWFLQAKGKFIFVCFFSIIGSLVTLAIGFYYVSPVNPYALDFSILTSCFGMLFVSLTTFIYSIYLINIRSIQLQKKQIFLELKAGWPLFLSQISALIYSGSGPIIINYFSGVEETGIYSITERIISALIAVGMLTHTAAYPSLSKTYAFNKKQYFKLVKISLFSYLSFCAIFSIGIIIFSEKIMQFLYHRIDDDLFKLLIWSIFWLIISIFGPLVTSYLTISGQNDKVWRITIRILLMTLMLAVPLVMWYGAVGWLASYVIPQLFILYTGIRYWIIEKKIDLQKQY